MEQNELLNELTWKELSEVEGLSGLAMDEWETADKKANLLMVLQFVMAKRNKPELTIEEVENMTVTQLMALATPGTLPKAKAS